MADLPSAVLFACSMNSIRSPMAEGILKFLHRDRIYVDSVGVRKIEINGYCITVMDEIGIDISQHKPKSFDDLEDSYFDLVIPLSPVAQHKAVEFFWQRRIVQWRKRHHLRALLPQPFEVGSVVKMKRRVLRHADTLPDAFRLSDFSKGLALLSRRVHRLQNQLDFQMLPGQFRQHLRFRKLAFCAGL